MKKLVYLLLLIVGCTPIYVKLSNNVIPKSSAIEVHTVIYETVIQFNENGFNIQRETAPVTFLGSGVFISPNGHILTCAHLFEGNFSTITVILANGHKQKAKLLYSDKDKDLALLKIDAHTSYAVLMTEELQIGEEVMAVGNPEGLEFSVTHGIVSYVDRNVDEPYTFTQTDAPINPGNSGGPLFNLKGELVGINSLKISDTDGLGFAISPTTIKDFLDMFRGLND